MSQQIINIGTAPNDGTGDQLRVSFDKTNDNFSELYTGAGSSSEGIWNYNQTDTDTTTSPVAGRFRTNNSSSAAATQIAIHVTTIRGIDRTKTLQRLSVGDVIELDDPINNNAWCRYVVQAAPVDYTTWFQINVGLLASGTSASSDNQEINFIFTANTNPAPGTTSEYRFSTATTPPPGNGYIRTNNVTLGAATILYVNNITNNGTDIKRVLADLITGQELAIQDQANNANYADYTITNTVIDQTAYFEIPVTSTTSGGAITNNTVIAFRIVGAASGGAGGNVSNVGTPINGQLAQWTDATHIQGVNTASMPFVELAGDTMTGPLILSEDPTSALQAATKQFVDASVSSLSPQGRLTTLSGTPVPTTTVAASSTIYYTPYIGRRVPLYNGTSFVMMDTGGELSQATTDTTKSPAATINDSNYDMFVWLDGSTMRCTRGPAWTAATVRGTGIGTTELERVQGFWVNKNAITNGPIAQRGTYVGTVRTGPSASTVLFQLGTIAANGGAAFLGIWNCYNRCQVSSGVVGDTTSSWTYNVAAWRSTNNSIGMRVSYIVGLNEDAVQATHSGAESGTTTNTALGIGLDSTTANSALSMPGGNQTVLVGLHASYLGRPGIGFHFLQALEIVQGATTMTFYGQLTPLVQNGLTVILMM